jgi:hypothetical protein
MIAFWHGHVLHMTSAKLMPIFILCFDLVRCTLGSPGCGDGHESAVRVLGSMRSFVCILFVQARLVWLANSTQLSRPQQSGFAPLDTPFVYAPFAF